MDETMGTLTISMGAKPLNYEANRFLEKIIKKIDDGGFRELELMLLKDFNESAENYQIYVP